MIQRLWVRFKESLQWDFKRIDSVRVWGFFVKEPIKHDIKKSIWFRFLGFFQKESNQHDSKESIRFSVWGFFEKNLFDSVVGVILKEPVRYRVSE